MIDSDVFRRRAPSLTFAVATAATATSALGQSCLDWYSRGIAGPSARFGHRMAYDSGRGVTVLFGGFPSNNQTWEWNGTVWTQRLPSLLPPNRDSHAMAYDSTRSVTVLFGGSTGSPLNDTWEWNGTTWSNRTPASSPPGRWGHGLTYDSGRHVCVLFGGYNGGGGDYADTWEWNGINWMQRVPITTPSARSGVALAYDSTRHVSVFFGGRYDPTNMLLADTWEWNGTNWSQRSPAIAPSPRNSHTMVFDTARGECVLFGGSTASGYNSETWEWNGSSWLLRSLSPLPPPVHLHAMTYDIGRRVAVHFGGQTGAGASSNTWELTNTAPAIDAGGPYSTSGQNPATLHGSAGQKSIHWSSGGTGMFVNADTLSPTYYPSPADVAAGSVTLTLTGNGPCGMAASTTSLVFAGGP